MRIHRIIHAGFNVSIWEYLRAGMSFDEILDRVPDEFYQWVKTTKDELENQYRAIEAEAKAEFSGIGNAQGNRALFYGLQTSTVLFQMLDGRSHADAIWKQLRPSFSKPFSQESEER